MAGGGEDAYQQIGGTGNPGQVEHQPLAEQFRHAVGVPVTEPGCHHQCNEKTGWQGPGRKHQATQKAIKALAKAKKVKVSDLIVCMLDRPRHAQLVTKVRDAGARIRLILDGDVSGAVAPALPGSGVDIFLGSGRALMIRSRSRSHLYVL